MKKLIVGISLILTLIFTLAEAKEYETMNESMTKAAERINKTTPKSVDAVTVLSSTRWDNRNKIFNYNYVLAWSTDTYTKDEWNKMAEMSYASMVKKINKMFAPFFKQGMTIVMWYYSTDSDLVMKIIYTGETS